MPFSIPKAINVLQMYLNLQVEEQDALVKNLQKQLKEAESLLSNTIYQANNATLFQSI